MPNGTQFGFCPAKALWSQDAIHLYEILVVACESGCMYERGGLADQPDWWMTLLSWFMPKYNSLKYAARVKAVLGDPGTKKMLGSNNSSASRPRIGQPTTPPMGMMKRGVNNR